MGSPRRGCDSGRFRPRPAAQGTAAARASTPRQPRGRRAGPGRAGPRRRGWGWGRALRGVPWGQLAGGTAGPGDVPVRRPRVLEEAVKRSVGQGAVPGPAASPAPRAPGRSQPGWLAPPDPMVASAPGHASDTSLPATPCSRLPWVCVAGQLLSCSSPAPWGSSQPQWPTEPVRSLPPVARRRF